MWDLYKDVPIALAKNKLPPRDMPGIAWYQGSFYNATDTTLYVPEITKPLPDAVAYDMRRAYYAAVSWMDEQVGKVLNELDKLGLREKTVVVIHGRCVVTG